ncbi:uncharacterized protein LOC143254609 [Tachypleus tridentatus]|uniref:uncharacterized protein LOC143254609 n=1 Tax=Tachypleus tridentatus TaxID=6853 RepID=UPI003FD30621
MACRNATTICQNICKALVGLMVLHMVVVVVIFQATKCSAFSSYHNITACHTCDEGPHLYFSVRNFLCCLVQSKCCGPESLDD